MTETHWTDAQRSRCAELEAAGAVFAFWCSDPWGGPANGGKLRPQDRARPGLVLKTSGAQLCSPGVLHATMEPHRWKGVRVWVVALTDIVGRESDKIGARRREIVGEVLPEEAIEPSVAVRLGNDANLCGADLCGADLRGADLYGADLRGADLYGANLYGANLRDAWRSESPPAGWVVRDGRLERGAAR